MYTCGNAKKLDASVKTCFIKIILHHEQCNEEEATKVLENIPRDKYNVDVFVWFYINFEPFYFIQAVFGSGKGYSSILCEHTQ